MLQYADYILTASTMRPYFSAPRTLSH